MPLRRRYRLAHLLAATALLAALLAVGRFWFSWVFPAAVLSQPLAELGVVGVYGPGVAVALLALVTAWRRPARRAGCFAAWLGVALAFSSPHLCVWYVWHVVGDHTANIGAGMLWMAQPVVAPGVAVVAWVGVSAVRAIFFGVAHDEPAGEE